MEYIPHIGYVYIFRQVMPDTHDKSLNYMDSYDSSGKVCD